MNPQTDTDRFLTLLHNVGEFYDVEVSPARATMFFRALERFEYPIVEYAFNAYLQSSDSKFGFPKPANIIEIVEGSQTEQESIAWMALNTAIRKIGIYQSVIFADPNVSDSVIRVWGGWIRCCEEARQLNAIQWEAKRKDFIAAFRIARKIPRKHAGPVLLTGLHQVENKANRQFPKRQPYGVILLDGRVESRDLQLDQRTGLPATDLRAVLALPEPTLQLLLPQTISEESGSDELIGEDAYITLSEAIQRVLKSKTFGNDLSRRASETLRNSEATTAGHTDRHANHGGESAGAETGIPIRGKHRPQVGGGSGVAGVSDPVRDRRGIVRPSGSRGRGRVDNEKSQRPKNPGQSRTERDRKNRRKA